MQNELIKNYKRICNSMFKEDKKEGGKIVAAYYRHDVDIADMEELKVILKKYDGLIELFDARDKFFETWKKYESTLNRLK